MNTGPTRLGSVATPPIGTPTAQAVPTPADKAATPVVQPPANRFAELLRRSRGEAPKPAQPAPVSSPAPHGQKPESSEASDAPAIESQAAPGNTAKARSATPKGADGKAAVDDTEQPSGKVEGTIDDDGADRIKPATVTALPSDRVDPRTVAAMAVDAPGRLPPASSAEIDDASGSGAGDRPVAVSMGDAARSSLGHARGVASVDAANDRHASAVDAGRATALGAGADPRFQVALAETVQTLAAGAPSPGHDRAIDALTASLAATTTRSAEPLAPTNAAVALALPTGIDAPDFAAALGVQVSVLVKDGVQQAELHLNPAETGPVSIRISLDGTAARVDFGADLAATRAAIERGLPELASALRDAGFTLAGGGVSQHAGGRSSGEDEAARATPRFDGDGTAAATPMAHPGRVGSRRVAAGGVDLYA